MSDCPEQITPEKKRIPNMSSNTLSDLKLASVTFPISDELAGLERLLPDGPDEIERFAILAGQTPSILEIRGRVLTNELQMDRFIDEVRLLS